MKGWFTHLHECVFILHVNMSGAKGVSPLDIFLFFGGSGKEGMEKVMV